MHMYICSILFTYTLYVHNTYLSVTIICGYNNNLAILVLFVINFNLQLGINFCGYEI